MSFSLSQSYEKFSKLREKLRQITGTITSQDANKNKKRQSIRITPPKNTQKDEIFSINKSKEFVQARGEQTERKKRKYESKQEQKYQMKENVSHNVHLLKKKQQALNEINQLLQMKKNYLDKIEKQLKRQNKKGIQTSTVTRDKMQQTLKWPSNKVKVPNLYEIQQQKRRQKQKICKQKYF